MNRNLVAWALAVGIGLSPAIVRAQASDAATKEAQKLYQEAAKDMAAQQYGTACPKLEAAKKILPDHVRTAMSLAECYDKLGQPATALETFEAARVLADAQKNADKLAEIDSRLADLRPRVPHLTLVVPKDIASLPGFSVLRNRVPVPVAQWGKALAVNPGTYQIEATALDKAAWNTSAEIQLGHDSIIEIKPPWNGPKETPSDKPEKPAVPPATKPTNSPLRTIGIVGISLGAVGMGAGAILGGLAISKNNASKDPRHCDTRNVCDQVGLDLRNESLTLGNGSTAAWIVGGVLATSGVVLFAMGGKKKTSGDEAQTGLWLGPTSAGLHGRW